MKSILTILTLLIVFQAKGQKLVEEGASASHYPLNMVQPDGTIKTVPLSAMKGKVIILQWWAGGCKGSGNNLKLFNDLANKFDKRALFFAVSNDKPATIHEFKKRNQFNLNFLKDKVQWANEYFSAGPASRIVIIDSAGKCLYKGHPSVLDGEQMEHLIRKNNLTDSMVYRLKKSKAYDSLMVQLKFRQGQAGFTVQPYDTAYKFKHTGYSLSVGRYHYSVAAPIYDLYKDGLFLTDYQIKVSDTLRKRLSERIPSNLFNMAYQIEKADPQLHKYSAQLLHKLNEAFGFRTRYEQRNDSVIVIKHINPTKSISKSLWYNTNTKDVKGDTILFKGHHAQNLCAVISSYMNMLFVTNSNSRITYEGEIMLSRHSTNRGLIVQQLKSQGIEAEVKLSKRYFLEFL